MTCGLAWAAGLRGVMAELAGFDRHLSGDVRLDPAARASSSDCCSAGRNTRAAQFLEDGIGGGALAVPLIGMLGGFALSIRGPWWAVLLAPIPGALVAIVLTG